MRITFIAFDVIDGEFLTLTSDIEDGDYPELVMCPCKRLCMWTRRSGNYTSIEIADESRNDCKGKGNSGFDCCTILQDQRCNGLCKTISPKTILTWTYHCNDWNYYAKKFCSKIPFSQPRYKLVTTSQAVSVTTAINRLSERGKIKKCWWIGRTWRDHQPGSV